MTPEEVTGFLTAAFPASDPAKLGDEARNLQVQATFPNPSNRLRPGMFVDVTIGVQQPDKVDAEKVKASLPHGIVTVKVVKGGLDIADPENNDPAVIASAAIAVRMEIPQAK